MAKAAETNVKTVQKALKALGLDDKVMALKAPLSDAAKAARELDAEPGAIAQTALYFVGKRMVLAVIAGDHAVNEANLGPAFHLEGTVRKPADGEIRGVTGFAAGQIPPVGLPHKLPAVIDRSLKRFRHVFAAAGSPHHAFRIAVPDLLRLTAGIVSYNVATPLPGVVVAPIERKRNPTFTGRRKLPG
jgi:prolyl-tRNA editing enzyme YbaK/EbsC (Cys-tRNA(Pro) deacylase)